MAVHVFIRTHLPLHTQGEQDMALLFADVVARYNAEKRNIDDTELTNKVSDFLGGLDDKSYTPYDLGLDEPDKRPQSIFVASVASEYYSKAQQDIANTKVGNKTVRKKNFKQVMQESFFYGSNRYGTNFIA